MELTKLSSGPKLGIPTCPSASSGTYYPHLQPRRASTKLSSKSTSQDLVIQYSWHMSGPTVYIQYNILSEKWGFDYELYPQILPLTYGCPVRHDAMQGRGEMWGVFRWYLVAERKKVIMLKILIACWCPAAAGSWSPQRTGWRLQWTWSSASSGTHYRKEETTFLEGFVNHFLFFIMDNNDLK